MSWLFGWAVAGIVFAAALSGASYWVFQTWVAAALGAVMGPLIVVGVMLWVLSKMSM